MTFRASPRATGDQETGDRRSGGIYRESPDESFLALALIDIWMIEPS
jgi:hypothetical protein